MKRQIVLAAAILAALATPAAADAIDGNWCSPDGRHFFIQGPSIVTEDGAVAERFLESPYLWGGRSSEGIDCSGLAQNALTSAGIAAPRDTDMQEAQLGTPLPEGAALQRGDLVFWKGHIGLMQDATRLIHANGWHMKVVSEPLKTAKDRISASGGGPVTSIRRL